MSRQVGPGTAKCLEPVLKQQATGETERFGQPAGRSRANECLVVDCVFGVNAG